MASGKGPGKKRRTREHIIADLSVNHVERHVLLAGYTMHRIVNDYGLDETIRTYNRNGEVETGLVWVQIKATDRLNSLKKPGKVAVRVERRDLIHWIGEFYPVILIIYDAANDHACWLHVQEGMRNGKVFQLAQVGASVTIHIPTSQIVNREAIRQFGKIKSRTEAVWRKEGKRK